MKSLTAILGLAMFGIVGQAGPAAEVPSTLAAGDGHVSYVFSTRDGLRLESLRNPYTDGNLVREPGQTLLFVLSSRGRQLSARDFVVKDWERRRDAIRDELTFVLEHAEWTARLKVSVDLGEKGDESRWNLELTRRAAEAGAVEVAFPVLGGLQIGDSIDDDRVHHGLNGGMFADRPILLRGEGGYSFPVMDIYDLGGGRPEKAGGLYLRVEDLEVQTKSLEVRKFVRGFMPLKADFAYRPEAVEDVFSFEQGLGLAVHYQEYPVAAGGTIRMPQGVFGVHPGRWERCWERYRDWVKTWYRPRRPRPAWWREIFVHRSFHQHDFRTGDAYPSPEMERKLSTPEFEDTWHWHYESGGRYRPAREIFRPYDDVAIYNHWMTWRGDYPVREDWGGKGPFARFLAEARGVGVRNSLYLEAVCVERRSPVGRAHGEEWAVLQRGRRLVSEGKLREYNMCPGSAGWRRHVAAETVRAMRDVAPDAVYLDSMGLRFSFCEDTSHGHPYRRGWHASVIETLDHVCREMDRVDPRVPLYLEFWSTDVATQFMSGCNSPVVSAGLDMERRGLPIARSGTCLFRFYFPDFKLIEIAPEDRTGMELSLFNGNAVHGSWRGQDSEALLRTYATAWRQNLDCFASDDVEPLIESGEPDVYLNRFGGGEKRIYALWNAGTRALEQVSVPIPVGDGEHAVEVLEGRSIEVDPARDDTHVLVDLPARRLSLVAVVGSTLRMERRGGTCIFRGSGPAGRGGPGTVELTGAGPMRNVALSRDATNPSGVVGEVELPPGSPTHGYVARWIVDGRLVDLIRF